MKRLGLFGLPLVASLAYAEQIGNAFNVLNEVDKTVLAADYSRIARAKIAGSDSTEVSTKVDYLFQSALSYQDSVLPQRLIWGFDVNGNKIGLIGKIDGQDFATADTLVVLGDSVSVNQKAIPKQRTQSSPLNFGARFGASYGTVSPEVGLVLGNKLRLVISGSPYSLPSARDPKEVTTHTSPDPVFGTMYETTVDTARVEKNMKNLSLGIILPQYKGLEATLGGGIHWEENAVKGDAETQKVDRNYVPLTHAAGRKGPFYSSKSSTSPMLNLGLDYKVSEHDAVGFYYQRVLGSNGKNRAGFEYRRNR